MRLARVAIDIQQAASAIGGRVHQDFVDHGVGYERAFACVERVGDRGESRVEIRVGDAAAFARATEMARAAAVDGAREIGRAGERHCAVEALLDAVAEDGFLAG